MLWRAAIASAVIALMSVTVGTALARGTAVSLAASPATTMPPLPVIGQSFPTPAGPGFVTGQIGSMSTTALPGGGQGLLLKNGNGTSTLVLPNGSSESVITPQ